MSENYLEKWSENSEQQQKHKKKNDGQAGTDLTVQHSYRLGKVIVKNREYTKSAPKYR